MNGSVDDLELTILMPCLNEAETVACCVEKAVRWLEAAGVIGEVLIADNGSTDGSRQLAAQAGARVIDVAMPGYGAALASGIANARGRYVIMGDADDSYDFSDLSAFLEKLRAGFQLVMGNRFAGGIAKGAMRPLHYYVGNPVLSFIGRLFFRSSIGDFHCGLRGFHRSALLSLDLHTTGMEFASEMVVKATLARLRIAEVPTKLRPDGRSRPSHLRSWRDGWRHLRFLLLYCPRWLYLLPGLSLMFLGALVFIWLVPGSRRIGNVQFGVHTLLAGAAFVVVGYQAVVFGILTKIFAVTEGLLPKDLQLSRAFKYITLEVGLVAGAVQIILGLGGMIAALLQWHGVGFRSLEPAQTMRIFIPAVTACMTGSQTVLASFYLSILGLRRR